MYQLVRYNVQTGTRKILVVTNDPAELLEMATMYPPNETKHVFTYIEPVN